MSNACDCEKSDRDGRPQFQLAPRRMLKWIRQWRVPFGSLADRHRSEYFQIFPDPRISISVEEKNYVLADLDLPRRLGVSQRKIKLNASYTLSPRLSIWGRNICAQKARRLFLGVLYEMGCLIGSGTSPLGGRESTQEAGCRVKAQDSYEYQVALCKHIKSIDI